MINMNELMKKELTNQDATRIHSNLPEKIVKQTKLIRDCVIYDEDGDLVESDVDFDRVMKVFGDQTGYEAGCSEIRIEKEIIDVSQIRWFLEDLNMEFVKRYNRKMVLYLQNLGNCYELRFHTFRQSESLWLADDLNEYEIPIVCYIGE